MAYVSLFVYCNGLKFEIKLTKHTKERIAPIVIDAFEEEKSA